MFAQLLLALLLAISSLTTTVFASPYTAVIVYGDSLSDNGNFFAATGIPGSPYFNGRRSNGPVAVEHLAASLGVPLVDNAWIGATTGIGNFGDSGSVTSPGSFGLPGMRTVYEATKDSLGPFVNDGLFVVWGGVNDLLAPSPLDSTPEEIITRAVTNQLAIISDLQARGAKSILVPGMPDLGLTPDANTGGLPVSAAEATAFAIAFNMALQSSLAAFAPGVLYYDTLSLLQSLVADPAAYGFTNVADPCFDQYAVPFPSICADPNGYVFFDYFHPTTATHAILAAEFKGALGIPEPPTLWLLVLMLGPVLALRRRTA